MMEAMIGYSTSEAIVVDDDDVLVSSSENSSRNNLQHSSTNALSTQKRQQGPGKNVQSPSGATGREDLCCLVCGFSFQFTTLTAQTTHLNACLDEYEVNAINDAILNDPTRVDELSQYSKSLTQFTQYSQTDTSSPTQTSSQYQTQRNQGIRALTFNCILCDVNLSRRDLIGRCQHVKSCSKKRGITTKELLEMIAPLPDSSATQATPNTQLVNEIHEMINGHHSGGNNGDIKRPKNTLPQGKSPVNAFSLMTASAKNLNTSGGFERTPGKNAMAKGKAKGGLTTNGNASKRVTLSSAIKEDNSCKNTSSQKVEIVVELSKASELSLSSSSSVVVRDDHPLHANVPRDVQNISATPSLPRNEDNQVASSSSGVSTEPAAVGALRESSNKNAYIIGSSTDMNSRLKDSAKTPHLGPTNGLGNSNGAPTGTTNSNSSAKGRGRNRYERKTTTASGAPYAPAYKLISVGNMSVPIVVDGFHYAHPALSDTYFLTHFHSDHYGGLSRNFESGTVFCSPTTAGLVRLKLNVSGSRIVPLPLEKEHVIDVGGVSVKVTLAEANHCPGAVVILFEFPNNKKVLHTGDFRWNPDLLRLDTYKRLAGLQSNPRDLSIYLDTTYCDAVYNFPPQEMTLEAVVDCVRNERMANPGALFVFGAYGIGKERVFMAVAETLDLKVYVDKPRWRMMLCYDWAKSLLGRLTTDSSKASLWVAPMSKINFTALQQMQKQKTCTKVIAFQPTGWTFDGKGKGANGKAGDGNPAAIRKEQLLKPRSNKDGNVIVSVPYSEHSAFGELVHCIRTFRPHKVIPTVGTAPDKVKTQLELLHSACTSQNSYGIEDNVYTALADQDGGFRGDPRERSNQNGSPGSGRFQVLTTAVSANGDRKPGRTDNIDKTLDIRSFLGKRDAPETVTAPIVQTEYGVTVDDDLEGEDVDDIVDDDENADEDPWNHLHSEPNDVMTEEALNNVLHDKTDPVKGQTETPGISNRGFMRADNRSVAATRRMKELESSQYNEFF